MKSNTSFPSISDHRYTALSLIIYWLLAAVSPARASMLHGDALDSLANAIAWVAIIIGPIIGIAVFWLVHILPEKIAEKKKHPQAGAIQCLCLLSLAFGGLLWPIAWLWAYTKPVLHKMAYGTEVDESHNHHQSKSADEAASEAHAARKGAKA